MRIVHEVEAEMHGITHEKAPSGCLCRTKHLGSINPKGRTVLKVVDLGVEDFIGLTHNLPGTIVLTSFDRKGIIE